jgi:hypothetical protein
MFPLLQGRHFLLRRDSAIIQTEGGSTLERQRGWLAGYLVIQLTFGIA